eukprot:7135331-Pyramimonas_sp.AAC.1
MALLLAQMAHRLAPAHRFAEHVPRPVRQPMAGRDKCSMQDDDWDVRGEPSKGCPVVVRYQRLTPSP